jgi:cytochrome b561
MSQDSVTRFGSITKLLHWVVAFLIIGQFYLIYRRWTFPKDSSESMQYIILHKSIGMAVLVLGIIYITWRATHLRPPYPAHMAFWEKKLARLTHLFLFLVMLAMPLTGYFMSVAGGHPVSWFNIFTFPSLIAQNKPLGQKIYLAHRYLSYAIIGFVILHTLGALKHHFINKDNVLKGMLPGWGKRNDR